MIIQCPQCRALVDVATVRIDGDKAGVACTACGTTSWLSSAPGGTDAPSSSTAAPAPPAIPATPGTTALVAAFDKADAVKSRLAAPDDDQVALAERFNALLDEKWHDDAAHKALLKAAAAQSQLAFVGSRYGAVLQVVRDEPKAKAAQQELITLAMATMQHDKNLGEQVSMGTGSKAVAAIVVFVVVCGIAFSVSRLFGTMSMLNNALQP